MKSFSQSHEAIPKQNGAYPPIDKTGNWRHAIHSRSALGPLAQRLFGGDCPSGALTITGAIAFLMAAPGRYAVACFASRSDVREMSVFSTGRKPVPLPRAASSASSSDSPFITHALRARARAIKKRQSSQLGSRFLREREALPPAPKGDASWSR